MSGQLQNQNQTNVVYTPPTDFTFNFPRLVKEVDTLVQDRVSGLDGKFREKTETEIRALQKSIDKAKEIFREDYKEETEKIFANIREELLESLNQGRSIFHLTPTRNISVAHGDHHQFEQIIETLLMYKKTLLVGKAGTGKTYMAEQFAGKMNLPFYKYSCSRDSSVHDLLGYKQPRSEEYLTTPFLRAYEQGGVFLVDEYDAMSADMALFFNGITDNSKTISVPHRDTNPVATKHEDFYVIFCGNTWGEGSIDFSGRDFQDMALMDRFRFSKHNVGYHTQLEISLCKNISRSLYTDMCKLRTALENRNSYLSTRNVEDIVMYLEKKLYHVIHVNETEQRNLTRQEYITVFLECVNKVIANMEESEITSILQEFQGENYSSYSNNPSDASDSLPF